MKTSKPNLVFFQVILFALAMASVCLIFFGFYTASWFVGFGTVLLLTTLIGITAFKYAPENSSEESSSMEYPLIQAGLSSPLAAGNPRKISSEKAPIRRRA